MADQLSLRGGTTAEHAVFTGANKEVTVDTTKKTLVVNDGATVGGHPLMRENASNSALALGSAGTPSLKFTGDTNTGIYSPGADQFAISTGGTGRITVDASGNVNIDSNTLYVDAVNNRIGMGTTNPDGRLHVLQGTTPNVAQLYVGQGGGSNNYYDATNHYFRDGNLNSVISTTSSTIQLFTGATERARIDSSGRLLVGTSSKSATASTTAKGVIGLGGGGSFICAEEQVANNGTINITVSTGGVHYFTGLLQVNSINASNGLTRTQSLISVLGDTQSGTITTSTLHTANGGAGQSFTITYVATGILRFTNTSGSTSNVHINYMGGGINAS